MVGEEEVAAVEVELDNAILTTMPQVYHRIGLGGTFDRFHAGHQYFLDFSASLAEHLFIGVTTKELTQHKVLASTIQSYEERVAAVDNYLQKKGVAHTIAPLSDIYGPTVTDSRIEALAVTELTRKGGEAVNEERQNRHLTPLPIHVCSLLRDQSGEYLSSTRIRQGVVNRHGFVYAQLLARDLQLTELQRQFFGQKQGMVVQTLNPNQNEKNPVTFVVGDVVLETFLQHHWPFQFGVFDGRNNRNEYQSSILSQISPTQTVTNPPGILSHNLSFMLQQHITSTLQSSHQPVQFIKVSGEEDLAAVALVLLAPLNSRIYYGQSGEGMIEMKVTEELKTQFTEILSSTSSHTK